MIPKTKKSQNLDEDVCDRMVLPQLLRPHPPSNPPSHPPSNPNILLLRITNTFDFSKLCSKVLVLLGILHDDPQNV